MAKNARIGIVGGGLAGLASAVALSDKNVDVELFDANENLGGRSSQSIESVAHAWLEGCQHVVSVGDSNFTHLLSRIGAIKEWEAHTRLHLYSPEGKRSDLYAVPGLPAPFHLAPSLFRLKFLNFQERWGVFKCLCELAKPVSQEDENLSILRWLRLRDQSPNVVGRFWATLLETYLGTSLELASLPIAREFILDRFMLHRANFGERIPNTSMRQALAEPAERWLEKSGVKLHRKSTIRMVLGSPDRCNGILLTDGANFPFDVVIVAVPWWILPNILSDNLRRAIPEIQLLENTKPANAQVVHLWFDRPISPLAHVILVSRFTQSVFRRHPRAAADNRNSSGFYYQAILNPAKCDEVHSTEEIFENVLRDLATIWPGSRDATLLRSQLTPQTPARFPCISDFEKWRPKQITSVPNLMLAGDWTQTGRPATLEGAVRSGLFAAEGVLSYLGCPADLLAPRSKTSWVARRLLQL